jgi:DNA-binding response OmpR family regulator
MGHAEELVCTAERRPPSVPESSDGMQVSPDPHSRGKALIMLVDDDELLLEALVELFEENKYRTKSFTKSEDALEYVKGHRPDIVLCDVNLRNSSFGGFTLFEKMTKIGHLHNVPFVFMSGLVDEAIIRAGKELGADDYLTKPFEPDMLLSVVKGKLRKYKFAETNH